MIQFEIPKHQSSIIKVIGVGGGGGNAVNYMHNLNIDNVDFIICNTDAQALEKSNVPNKIQLGPHLTQGLGAGANPNIGKQASEESLEDIKNILQVNTKMAFITAGMGGGTGTGGAPVVAKICKDLGILTVGIVTMPFSYEGKKRMQQAIDGIQAMKDHVDTILIISNDKLRQQFGNLPFTKAFEKADDILSTAAKCITDVINTTGQINVDFADVCTVMRNGGKAILGNAEVGGDNRAQLAVEQALNSPLLNDDNISGAKWILLNITSAAGEFEHTMDEAETIQAYVQQQAGDNCDVILGMGHDETLGDRIGVTIIATGFEYGKLEEAIKVDSNKVVITLDESAPFDSNDVNFDSPMSASAASTTSKFAESLNRPWAKQEPKKDQEQPLIPIEDKLEFKSNFTLKTDEPIQEQSTSLNDQFALELDKPQTHSDEISLNFTSEDKNAPSLNDVVGKDNDPLLDQINQSQQSGTTNEFKLSERELTPFELEERRIFEEQKKSLEERAERLRQMSFNINNQQSLEDIERTPAYLRAQAGFQVNPGAEREGLSGYSIGPNQNGSGSQIQTVNTFLQGNKPD